MHWLVEAACVAGALTRRALSQACDISKPHNVVASWAQIAQPDFSTTVSNPVPGHSCIRAHNHPIDHVTKAAGTAYVAQNITKLVKQLLAK